MKVGLPQDVNIAICRRPFLGHSKAVRDISFNNSGAQFLSAAYDRYVKLWDTETGGECLHFCQRYSEFLFRFIFSW